jgi:hypothetical protein
VAENQIYTDADQSGRTPAAPEGQLVEWYSTDAAGRKVVNFSGESRTWLRPFMGERRRVVGIRTNFKD